MASKIPDLNEMRAASGGSWFKTASLKEGPKTLRILDILMMWENWTPEGKPLRAPSLAELEEKRPAKGWRVEDGEVSRSKLSLAAYAWGYPGIVVCQFSQKSIQDGLKLLQDKAMWGDLSGYDVELSRTDNNGKVDYNVTPGEKGPLPKEAQEEWKRVQDECIGLAALFSGGNPMDLFGN
jgi:hypothetical protein